MNWLAGWREEVLLTVADAQSVFAGNKGELLALRMVEADKALVVIYRELGQDDGFILTAFVSRRLESLRRRRQLWPSST